MSAFTEQDHTMARAPYLLTSDHSGTVEFRREPARNGGHIVALLPRTDARRHADAREALTVADGYVEVPRNYVRTLRHADPTSAGDRRAAENLLARINRDDEYALSLLAH